jgi:hypothetical protein
MIQVFGIFHSEKELKTKIAFLSCILIALFCGPAANASVIMTLEDVGSNVVGTANGNLNLNALTYDTTTYFTGEVNPSSAILIEGNGPNNPNADLYSGTLTGPTSFGTGGGTTSSTLTGYPVGVAGGYSDIIVPIGYVSGSPLSTSDTWDGTSLAALGVTPGIYTWTWGSGANADSLTLYAGVSPVPEPAPALLLILGVAALALFRRRFR